MTYLARRLNIAGNNSNEWVASFWNKPEKHVRNHFALNQTQVAQTHGKEVSLTGDRSNVSSRSTSVAS
eukprot:3571011-Amphidinium_carterae.1